MKKVKVTKHALKSYVQKLMFENAIKLHVNHTTGGATPTTRSGAVYVVEVDNFESINLTDK